MDGTASRVGNAPPRPPGAAPGGHALSLPNILTYLRILAVPAVVGVMFVIPTHSGRWIALAVFAAACLTDWLDGHLARIWGQQSALGQMLDPIADKLLVGATLLQLTHDNTIHGAHIWAALIILCREILVSGLREYLAGLNVKISVTKLAKWKTTLQMVALGTLLAGPAGNVLFAATTSIGLGLLWLAALLTLWTGYDYLRAAVGHAIERP
jgi:CDP-diacylglycerol--glycerol-3-phosphate 3-phosphatidyltransferase/cardiolipin synthase